jgi:hypothetical protein
MTKSISTKKTAPAKAQGPLPSAPDAARPPAISDECNDKPTGPAKSPDTGLVSKPKPPSKADQLAALVVRDEGATLDQMVAALGWLPHTTRAALTGLRKKGFAITSDKVDGVRTYRAVAPE